MIPILVLLILELFHFRPTTVSLSIITGINGYYMAGSVWSVGSLLSDGLPV
jgi:hypothetical protein